MFFDNLQFLFQILHLKIEYLDVSVKGIDVTADGVYRPALVTDLRVDDHQILQTFLHVLLVLTKFSLLLLHLLLELLTLILQPFHRDGLLFGGRLPGRSLLGRFLSRLLFGYSLSCSGFPFGRSLLLRGESHYKR